MPEILTVLTVLRVLGAFPSTLFLPVLIPAQWPVTSPEDTSYQTLMDLWTLSSA